MCSNFMLHEHSYIYYIYYISLRLWFKISLWYPNLELSTLWLFILMYYYSHLIHQTLYSFFPKHYIPNLKHLILGSFGPNFLSLKLLTKRIIPDLSSEVWILLFRAEFKRKEKKNKIQLITERIETYTI